MNFSWRKWKGGELEGDQCGSAVSLHHAHGEESVATCPHDKANKDDMTYTNQIIANILATHEAKKERKPKQIGVKPGEEMLETKSKPMISNPNSK